MSFRKCFVVWALPLAVLQAQAPVVASFQGSGATSIQAMTSDAAGNIYVAGTTAASDLPLKNAMQPKIGESPIMRTTDSGRTWQKLRDVPTGTLEIAPHPGDPQILLIGGENGIDKSPNGGQSWSHVFSWSLAPYEVPLVNIAIDPANPALAYALMRSYASPSRFLVSTDGGDTWADGAKPESADIFDRTRQLWVDPHGSGAVVLGNAVSRDRAKTWSLMNNAGDGRFHEKTLRPDPHHPGWIFALTSIGATNYLYRSTDWGLSWTELTGFADLAFDPDQADLIYATTNRGALFVSKNAGATWTALAESGVESLAAVSRRCTGGGLLSLTYRGVAASSDFGQTWSAPQLTLARQLISGPACAVYALRATTSDAFVAKLSPQGEVLWSTFLGGMDRDAATAIATGPNGSLYVAGNTASPDFPGATLPAGPPGRRYVYITRFDADGSRKYSTIFGDEFDNSPTTLSVDGDGSAYLAGSAGSIGFAAKVTPDGGISYVTKLPYATRYGISGSFDLGTPRSPLPIAASDAGTALIAGAGQTLSRLSADGANLERVATLPGPIQLLAVDSQSDVYVAGQIITPPFTSYNCFYGYVNRQTTYLPAADTYVTKLKAGTFESIFTRRLTGTCRTQPTDMKISPSGEVSLGVWTFSQFPLRDPVQASLRNRTAIARISADGAGLLFSSYLTGATAIAVGESGALFAAAYSAFNAADVKRMPLLASPTLSIESISQSVTGLRERVLAGSLATITGSGFVDTAIDLGLDYAGPLPRVLGGVQVLFDGVAAELLQVAPGHIVFVAPGPFIIDGWSSVQVVTATEKSTPFLVNGESFPRPALLTRAFPFSPAGNVDGAIRNADGTENSPSNPAERGTTVTLFVTGVQDPGKIDLYWAPKPFEPNPNPSPFPTGPGPIPVTAVPMPGFLSLLYQIKFTIPKAVGPGVAYLPPPGVVTRVEIGISNVVRIWIK